MTEVARKIGGRARMRKFLAMSRQGKIIAIPKVSLSSVKESTPGRRLMFWSEDETLVGE
jgi:hypothetical protein